MKVTFLFIALVLTVSCNIAHGFTVTTSSITTPFTPKQQQRQQQQQQQSSTSRTSSKLESLPISTDTLDQLSESLLNNNAAAVHSLSSVSSSVPTTTVAAGTVDPTTFFSGVLGGIIGTPIILAVPILAAISVAGVIAWFIISYANPADPDDP